MKMIYDDDSLKYELIQRDDGSFMTGTLLCVKIDFKFDESATAQLLSESFKRKVEPTVASFREYYQHSRVITATGLRTVCLSVEVSLLAAEKREELYRAIKHAIGQVLKEVCC